jgi:TIR domain-containing protein
MGRAIFISYRRDDTEGEAGRLFDDLTRSFGENSVFMDVSGINPGADFRKAIDDNVAACGVLLAMIGPQWSSIRSGAGERRLDDPNDFVRLEIASALARKVAVIPVLVHDAKMPRPEDLPDNLKDLAFRNSVEITHARWNSDVQLLTDALTRYVSPTAQSDTKPVHATVAVQLPPPTAPAGRPASTRPSSVPLILGVVAAVVVALGIVGFIMFRPHNPLIGSWTNATAVEGNSLNRLEITSSGGGTLSIHAWGKCAQPACDWGTQTANYDGQQAQATWQLTGSGTDPARTSIITIRPNQGQLSVTVANTFTDRPPNGRQSVFVNAQ